MTWLNPARSSQTIGAQMFDQIVRQTPPVDAIFFCNDDLAQGALLAAARARSRAIHGGLAMLDAQIELLLDFMGVGPGLTVSSAAGAPLIVGSAPAPGATSGLLQLVTGNGATSGDILIVPGTGTTARGNLALGTSVASWQSMQGGVFVGNRAAASTA